MLACAEGRLDSAKVNWADDHALTVVMAAKGYPRDYVKNTPITLNKADLGEETKIFHAGTARGADGVLAVSQDAESAYGAVDD
mgnify:CR=1 FL=1